MKLSEIVAVLFPYRTHLEDEVKYLREQLAQKQRRIDEMRDWQQRFVGALTKRTEKKPPALVPVRPHGWEQARRAWHGSTESGTDAGRESEVDGSGTSDDEAILQNAGR